MCCTARASRSRGRPAPRIAALSVAVIASLLAFAVTLDASASKSGSDYRFGLRSIATGCRTLRRRRSAIAATGPQADPVYDLRGPVRRVGDDRRHPLGRGALCAARRQHRSAATQRLQGPEFVVRSRNRGATWTALSPEGPRPAAWCRRGCTSIRRRRASGSSRRCRRCAAPGSRGATTTALTGTPIRTSAVPGRARKGAGRTAADGGSRPHGYRHVVYYCANGGIDTRPTILYCYRSLDGARTFRSTGGVPDPPGAAGKCGVNHVARPGVAGPDGVCISRSTCAGTSGSRSAVTRERLAPRPLAHTTIADVYMTSVATDSSGDVYVAWLAATDARSEAPGRGLPYLTVSRNHGRTWGKPMMLAPPGSGRSSTSRSPRAGRRDRRRLREGKDRRRRRQLQRIHHRVHRRARAPTGFLGPHTVNKPTSPLYPGSLPETFGDRLWFIGDRSDRTAPRGRPFTASMRRACPAERIGVAGRLTAS